MTARTTIADVARAAGVSVATVDRVLNRRARVRTQTARRVLEAAERMDFRASRVIRAHADDAIRRYAFGFLLQKSSSEFYRSLAAALEAACRAATRAYVTPVVEYVEELGPASIAKGIQSLAARVDAVGVVATDHPRVSEAAAEASANGVPVFAMLADLSAPARAGYVGLDQRQTGRTAAWAVSRLSPRPGPVCVMLGSHRYLNQELCEISFRSYLREHAPDFRVLETMVSLEEPAIANAATEELLHTHPDLAGIYVAGGGIEGAIEALRGVEPAARPVTVCPDLTSDTRRALLDGVVDLVISHPLDKVAERTVGAMLDRLDNPDSDGLIQVNVPCEIYTPENA